MLKAKSHFVPPPKLPPPAPVVDVGDAEMRAAQDLLFFAYRDFTNVADQVLEELRLGRAHHRALHFIGRNPGITVSGLLAILRITKQSLARVLNALVDEGYVSQAPGYEDRRLRLLTLTEKGKALEQRLFDAQREKLSLAYTASGPQAVQGFRTLMRAMMDSGARAYMDGTGSAEDASELADDCHILVVEDDPRLRERLARYLTGEGFRVTAAGDAAEARTQLRAINPDLMVLDVMMPGESGLDLTQSLRLDSSQNIPILLLTARGAPEDRIAGFEAGADDYLGKPFEPRELVLRIRALLRRAPPPVAKEAPVGPLRIGEAEFDVERGELRDATGPIRLTGGEAALLTALASKPNEVLSREDIAEALGMDDSGERAIDVQVVRLRRKIEADPREPRFLHTVRGRGYILKPGA